MNRRRVSVLIAAVLTAAAGLLAPATPALAIVHCDGAGCNGKRLTDTDCKSQAYAITSAVVATSETPPVTLGRGDLYYSPTCHAMWGDFTASSALFVGEIRIDTQPEYGGVNSTAFAQVLSGSGNLVTTLTDWQKSVRLCASTGAGDNCSPWR